MAGSPCPVEVMLRVRSDMHMGEVTICYGMTETSPVSTQNAPRCSAREAGGSRRPSRDRLPDPTLSRFLEAPAEWTAVCRPPCEATLQVR
jgi:acyl-CoA synthetase (AMP-forming)/AMP-acid ligase II